MPGSELVRSLLRGLDVVDLLARSDGGLRLADVARALGLKAPTAHNLLRTLAARRFVEKEEPGLYRLGTELGELARLHGSRSILRRAEGALGELFASYGDATVLLCEATGGEVAVSLRIAPERPGLVERPRGRTMHPYGSASALVFQAFWTEEERGAFRVRHPFWEFGAHLWRDEGRLDRFLAGVRKRGYAAPRVKDLALFVVAAPVFAESGELVASVGVSFPPRGLTRKTREGRVRRVVSAARELRGSADRDRHLGAREPRGIVKARGPAGRRRARNALGR
jgi:DNA-binding IclR family transcriptional regulator